MKKINLYSLLAIVVLTASTHSLHAQVHVNRVYQQSFGNPVFNPVLTPFGIQWSKSLINANEEHITVGHTAVSGEGENILLSKKASDGSLLFQVDFNTSASHNDYGIGLYEDASTGDIYVCGTTDNGGLPNAYRAVILKYDATGNLSASISIGPASSNHIATDLIIHPSTGNLLVAICAEGSSTGFDYKVVELNPTSLNQINSAVYDYNGLTEVVLGIEVDINGNILLIGGSQSTATCWAYSEAIFNGSTLAYISDVRTNIGGFGGDEPLAYKKDPLSQAVYITGRSLDPVSSKFNIKTVKIAPNYTIAWTSTLNVHGMDNAANTIDTDPVTGDVIIGGYATKTNNVKEMYCARLNPSTGAVIHEHKQASENAAGDAGIKKLCSNTQGDVYFTAVERGNSNLQQVVAGKIKASGFPSWQRKISDVDNDVLPSDIEVTSNGLYLISVLDSLTDAYLLTKYEEFELDTAKIYLNGQAAYTAHELLVDFHPTAINKAAINNEIGTRIAEFGNLSDFLTVSANNAVNLAFETSGYRNLHFKAIRVHSEMKTTDTMGVSRLGQPVPNPPVWSILLLQIPNTITLQKAKTIFSSIKNHVSYVQYDNFMEVTSPPNDSLYSVQANLHPVSPHINAHINVEDAWNVVTGCGASFVKGGIFDTGVMWRHKEFSYDGTPTSGQNKMQGWYFGSGFGPFSATNGGVDMRTSSFGLPDFMLDPWANGGHGTAVAGIIGAKRNNTSGISGIAGGDDANGNDGVSLYSLNIQVLNKMSWVLKAYHAAHGDPTQSTFPFNYGLHFSNHSYKMTPGWWGIDSFPLYKDEVHFANRMGVSFVASRGNDSTNNFVAPANYDSCWVISVGASAANGLKWSGSSYGSGMDVIAPGTHNIVTSTANDRHYKPFAGTSAAAPHVSGVVALLMSYMNKPDGSNDYMNLAPEDCDFIIQRSATDVGPPGYDSLHGYGRLNAGAALRMVEKPYHILYHFGTNTMTPHSITKSVYSNSDTIRLTEKYVTPISQIVYNPGKYVVKTYQVNANVSHPGLYPTDSLMYYWPRHSSSYVYDLPNTQKKLDMHERVNIVSLSGGSANLRGYVYQVWDTLGNPKGWWPCDTSFNELFIGNLTPKTLMEYSVLTKNKAVGIKEHVKTYDNISLFPNPASQQQILRIKSDKESNCKIELYDMMGRKIRTVYNGKVNNGSNDFVFHVAELANSMYIYIINIDGETTSRKFIKE